MALEKEGFGSIYKITHKSTGNAYVGLTRHLADRIRAHSQAKTEGCRKLYHAIRKHGMDAFDMRVLYAGFQNTSLETWRSWQLRHMAR